MFNSQYQLSESPKLIAFNQYTDSRGNLNSLELENLGISARRVFTISFSGLSQIRGEHAHKNCVQFLFSDVSFQVASYNLLETANFFVTPAYGILVPPYNWIQISSSVPSCRIVVLASEAYSHDDYIFERPL